MKPPPLLDAPLQLAGRLDARWFALLQAIDDTGSLQRAARTAGYSYKGAWLLLDTAANRLQAPLLERRTGGRGGGGSQLTPQAQLLLAAWRQLNERHQCFLREQEDWLRRRPELAALFRRLAMKTTARNQFVGRVQRVLRGPASSLIELDLGQGLHLQASVAGSAATPKKGSEALAMVKASEVVLVTDFAGLRLLEDNRFDGVIARIVKGGASALVGLTLPGGLSLSASVTTDALDALGLRVGQSASACFKAAAVMLAVPDKS